MQEHETDLRPETGRPEQTPVPQAPAPGPVGSQKAGRGRAVAAIILLIIAALLAAAWKAYTIWDSIRICKEYEASRDAHIYTSLYFDPAAFYIQLGMNAIHVAGVVMMLLGAIRYKRGKALFGVGLLLLAASIIWIPVYLLIVRDYIDTVNYAQLLYSVGAILAGVVFLTRANAMKLVGAILMLVGAAHVAAAILILPVHYAIPEFIVFTNIYGGTLCSVLCAAGGVSLALMGAAVLLMPLRKEKT